jgi:hypothetical protein
MVSGPRSRVEKRTTEPSTMPLSWTSASVVVSKIWSRTLVAAWSWTENTRSEPSTVATIAETAWVDRDSSSSALAKGGEQDTREYDQ